MNESVHQLIAPMRPELVAEKLQAIHNHEYPELLKQITEQPRLVEMMWFLQYVSMQPGGLVKFSAEMMELMPARFGTETMRATRRPEYSLQEKTSILSELPPKRFGQSWGATWRAPFSDPAEDEIIEGCFPRRDADDYNAPELRAQRRRQFEQDLKAWTAQDIRKLCTDAAKDILPKYLEDICVEKGKGFERPGAASFWETPYWLMSNPIEAVFEMMDCHAAEASRRIAMTVVAKKVFDALDYALQERVMVRVKGDSRFGKTEAIKAWAAMRPGVARVATVPSSNRVGDLVWNVAEALGIEAKYRARAEVLRDRVKFVLRYSRLFLILDESQFLMPQTYTRETAPQRLNWVRTEIADRGLPVALTSTVQTRKESRIDTFDDSAAKFVKKTGFVMEQFFGRIYRTVQLPDELPRADLIAVAAIHFPEVTEQQLERIADLAELSNNYLQTVEAVAKLARHIARREGHRRITDSDLKAAACEVVPRRAAQEGAADPAPKATRRASPALNAAVRNAASRVVSTGINATLIAPSRAVDFQSRSLRSAGSERPQAELIPAEA